MDYKLRAKVHLLSITKNYFLYITIPPLFFSGFVIPKLYQRIYNSTLLFVLSATKKNFYEYLFVVLK